MKTTIKLISLLLVFVMCFAMFASCKKQKGGGEQDSTSGVSGNNSLANELPAQDFGKKEFTVLDANDHSDMHINFSEDLAGTAIEAELYKRDMYLEERNNVDIAYVSVNNVNTQGIPALTNEHQAGNRPYDMVIATASGGRMSTLSTEGVFTDLVTLPTLDLSGKWWSSQMFNQMALGGKMYFTTGDIAASVYDAPFATYANRTLLNEYGLTDDLYQKVKDGTWTYEYLTEITKNLYSELGTPDGVWHADDDFFGVVCEPNKMTVSGILVGMGCDLSTVNGTSIVVNDNLELLDGIINKIKRGVVTVNYNKDDKAAIINSAFKGNRAVFLIHLMEAANHKLRDMSSDFLVLPMPKGDETQENYRSYMNGWVNCFVAVPTFAEDETYKNMVGYMLEAMARASYDIVRPVAFDEVVMYQSIKEPGSIEMLNIIYDNLYLDFQCIYDFGGGATLFADCVFNDAELSSGLRKISDSIKNEAAKISAAWIQN